METGDRGRRGGEAAGAALTLALLLAACAPPSEPPPVVASPPPPQQIIVERGQTLSGIAHAYHVPMLVIADANHLSPPYRILVGQMLIVPSVGAPVAASPTMAMAEPNPAPVVYPGAPTSSAAPPGAAVVAEPLAAATPAAPTPPPLVPLDRPPPASAPSAGAPLPLTPNGSAPASLDRPRPPSFGAAPATVATLSPPAEQGAAGAAVPPRSETPAAAGASAHGSDNFLWPVKGHVVEGYGTGPDGTRNDGINIAAPKGAAIEATDDGVVAYAGNELRGYGNLILIKHANGWISAYAHCDVILVKTGQKVARGQVIARVGATGNVDAPQLHFELRRGKKPVDPRQYLATSPAEAGKQTHSG